MTRARFVSVHPVLPVRDVQASLDFYVDRLGFSNMFADAVEGPRYAGVGRDGVVIHLQWHDPAEWERVERPMLRFLVPGVEALFEEYSGRGVFHAHTRLRDTAWGTREFAFFDPDHNGLTFYRELAAP